MLKQLFSWTCIHLICQTEICLTNVFRQVILMIRQTQRDIEKDKSYFIRFIYSVC